MVGDNFTLTESDRVIGICREAAASLYGVGRAIEEGARVYDFVQSLMAKTDCGELERVGITVKKQRRKKPKPTPLQQKMLRQKWNDAQRGEVDAKR